MWNKLTGLKDQLHAARGQSVGMQRRLMLYWVSMILAVFAALLLVLSVAGVFSGSDQKLNQALITEQNNVSIQLAQQMGALTAQGVALSSQITNILDDALYIGSVSTLNDQGNRLIALERQLFTPLNAAIQSSPCNGVFVILDATTNTAAPTAETSRAGLYLRFMNLSNKSAVNQDIVYFRGVPEVARENQLELHNRWNLEFDTSRLPGYARLMGQTVTRLADSAHWTGRVRLTDTWEDALLLLVPIQGSNGTTQGVCGIELGDLYFRLSYPAYQSEFGSMVTVLAPMSEGRLRLSQGMTGGLEGTYLSNTDTLTVKEGNYFNTYEGESGTFLGIHTRLNLEINEAPVCAVTLIAQDSWAAAAAQRRTVWILSSLCFLLLMLGLSFCLSRRFVKPIFQSFQAIQEENALESEPSGISEIDALMDFIRSKNQNQAIGEGGLPPDIAELFNTFARRAESLTATERNILRYYADGREISEVAELAYISIHTVRKHNANMYQKLGVGSRDELMLYLELFRRCGRLDELF